MEVQFTLVAPAGGQISSHLKLTLSVTYYSILFLLLKCKSISTSQARPAFSLLHRWKHQSNETQVLSWPYLPGTSQPQNGGCPTEQFLLPRHFTRIALSSLCAYRINSANKGGWSILQSRLFLSGLRSHAMNLCRKYNFAFPCKVGCLWAVTSKFREKDKRRGHMTWTWFE